MHTGPLDLKRLCDLAGVTPRTVYFYVQQGLLPHAGTHGPGAKYGRRHLTRLQLVKLLQREHLPLAEIRERLLALSDAEVEQALAGPVAAPAPASDGSAKPPVGSSRSRWDRVALTPDVELHIRRPLTRERNKQVERLLEEARKILKEGGR